MERPSKKGHSVNKVSSKQENVVFFHPDLGIGGAERLVVDAAVGLKNLGNNVTIFTSHRDTSHCFEEARDGTLDVRVRGDTIIPPTILGRFKVLCSILRQLHLLVAITRSGELAKLKPSVFFLDQLSAGIPFLRWYWEDTQTLFYCHFPDLLLVQNRKAWYKRLWRIGFDWWESWSIRGADRVVVNSRFTKDVVERIWPGLGGNNGVGVLYPSVDTKGNSDVNGGCLDEKDGQQMWKSKKVLLSINRFEKKKNVALAIHAFGGLTRKQREGSRLVIAGGYDVREAENIACHKALESLADSLGLKHATAKNIVSSQSVPPDIEVLFLLSVPDKLKTSLLKAAKLLIYTPSDEHFGIVPLEGMLAGVPVLAANTGGPLETVVDGETGWLRSPEKEGDWTDVLGIVLKPGNERALQQMGEEGKKRVEEEFSETKLAHRLDEELEYTIKARRPQAAEIGDLVTALALYVLFSGIIVFIVKEGIHPQMPGLVNQPRDIALGVGIIALALLGMIAVTWKLTRNDSAFT